MFHLSYIRAKDAKDIITSSSLLSEIGTIGMTPEARGGLYDYRPRARRRWKLAATIMPTVKFSW